MTKQDRTYHVCIAATFVDSATEVSLVDSQRILKVVGTDACIYVTGGLDFLHIKDRHGAVVFAAPSHTIRYCIVKPSKPRKDLSQVLRKIGD